MPAPQAVLTLIENFEHNLDATEHRIGQLVYALYGLAKEEYMFVEGL